MGLLDGVIQNIIHGAMAWLFIPGTLIPRVLVTDDKGTVTATDGTPVAIEVVVDPATQVMRQAEGFREDDIALIVLAKGIPEPRLDDRIITRGMTYHVLAPIIMDPAMATYTLRGRKV